MGNKRYRNPPILEAVCQFLFGSLEGEEWDLTIPGRLYEKLGGEDGEFPIRETARKEVEVGIVAGPEGIVPRIDTKDHVRFFNFERNVLIQVAPYSLTISHLRPYTNWKSFLPKIRKAYDSFCEVTGLVNLERIGLRYVNQIELPSPTELEEYFEFRPFIGETLPQDFFSFIAGVQIAYNDMRDILRLQLASAPPVSPDTQVAILDIDYYLAQQNEIGIHEAMDWVDQVAHEQIEKVFEETITDKLREKFEEID